MTRVTKARVATIVLFFSCISSPAWATNPEVQRAFERGRTLLREGKVDEAAQQFLFVVEREPAVGALLNLGECYERLGKPARAHERFTEAAALATELKDERATEARARAAKLEPTLGRLVFAWSSQLASHKPVLVLDGETLAKGSENRLVEPGHHTLEIRFEPPTSPETRTIDAVAGATQTVLIDRPSAPAPAPAPAAPSPAPSPAPGPSLHETTPASPAGATQRWVGIGVAGAGVVGVAVGAVFGVITMGKASTLKSSCASYPRCSDASFASAQATYDSGHTSATISTVGFIAGGLLVAGGAVVYFTAPSGTAVSVSPTASGGAIDLSARF